MSHPPIVVCDSDMAAKELARCLPMVEGTRFYGLRSRAPGLATSTLVFILSLESQLRYPEEIRRWKMRLLPEGQVVILP